MIRLVSAWVLVNGLLMTPVWLSGAVTGASGSDVPVHEIARDPALLEPFFEWGFRPGAFPDPEGSPHGMDEFRESFVRGVQRWRFPLRHSFHVRDSFHEGGKVTNGFGVGARLFHWLVVLLLLVQIPAGIAMIAPALEQSSIDRLFILHKGLGVVLLAVVVARALWRLTHRAPPMAESIPELERRMATTAHWVIYAVLVVVAGSGYVHVVGDGFPIEMMEALGLPTLLPLMPEVASWASLVHRSRPSCWWPWCRFTWERWCGTIWWCATGRWSGCGPRWGAGASILRPNRSRRRPVGWRRAERWLGLVRSLIMYWRPGRQRGAAGAVPPLRRRGGSRLRRGGAPG